MGEVVDEGPESEVQLEVEGSSLEEQLAEVWGDGPRGGPVNVRKPTSDHEELRLRHEQNLGRLRLMREQRDAMNDAIRDAVRDEDLSRRALAVYEKAVEGS
jgi:hypothetical protein